MDKSRGQVTLQQLTEIEKPRLSAVLSYYLPPAEDLPGTEKK